MGIEGDSVGVSISSSAAATNASTVALMSGVGLGTSVELFVELEEVVQLTSIKTDVNINTMVF